VDATAVGEAPVRQWHPSDIRAQDPGLADVVYGLLPVLNRHLLISGGYDVLTRSGREPEYTITAYGDWFLTRLAEPEKRGGPHAVVRPRRLRLSGREPALPPEARSAT
jgi:hypothetical protein